MLRSHLHAWIWDDHPSALYAASALFAESQEQQEEHKEENSSYESVKYSEEVVLAEDSFCIRDWCTPLEAVCSGDKTQWSSHQHILGRVSVRVADSQAHTDEGAFVAVCACDESCCADVDSLSLEVQICIAVKAILPARPETLHELQTPPVSRAE